MRIRKRKPIGKKTIKYIEKLYEAYSRKLFCIAKNHVKDDDLAQDVVQSVFEKALVYPESILEGARGRSILFSYGNNKE